MAYTAQTLFPTAEAGEGANNHRIRDVVPAENSATICSFGTNTTVRFIQAKPGTTNSTSATPAAAQDFGWNVLKSDMNETGQTPNKRRIPAGDWVFQGVLPCTGADLQNSYKVRVYIHKRSAAGALTQIGTFAESGLFAGTGTQSWGMTFASVPEIILELDETIHLEFWVQGRSTGLTAQNCTFKIGPTSLQQTNQFTVPSPGIRTRFTRSLVATAVTATAAFFRKKVKTRLVATATATAAFFRKKVKKLLVAPITTTAIIFRKLIKKLLIASTVTTTAAFFRKTVKKRLVATSTVTATIFRKRVFKILTATMLGVPTLNRLSTLFRTMQATMLGVATMTRALVLARTLAVTMVGVATLTKVMTLLRTMQATMVGVPSIIKRVGKIIPTATMIGVATMTRLLTLFRTMNVTMVGVATMNRALVLARTLVATMVGIATLTRALTIRRTLTATMVGIPTVAKRVGKVMPTVIMVGIASVTKRISKIMPTVTMIGVATMTRALVLSRIFQATMVGVVRAIAGIPFERVPGGEAPIFGSTYSRSRVDNR